MSVSRNATGQHTWRLAGCAWSAHDGVPQLSKASTGIEVIFSERSVGRGATNRTWWILAVFRKDINPPLTAEQVPRRSSGAPAAAHITELLNRAHRHNDTGKDPASPLKRADAPVLLPPHMQHLLGLKLVVGQYATVSA